MRPQEQTLTNWPLPVMMPRSDHDPIRMVHEAFDRLDRLADRILEQVEKPPPTDRSPNWWEP